MKNGPSSFEPFSTTQRFTVNNVNIDGVGAALAGTSDQTGFFLVGFLLYDLDSQTYYALGLSDYGPVSNIGIEWTSIGVTLYVNGQAKQTLSASTFGFPTIARPNMNGLSLISTGNNSRVRFDNICQTRIP